MLSEKYGISMDSYLPLKGDSHFGDRCLPQGNFCDVWRLFFFFFWLVTPRQIITDI